MLDEITEVVSVEERIKDWALGTSDVCGWENGDKLAKEAEKQQKEK